MMSQVGNIRRVLFISLCSISFCLGEAATMSARAADPGSDADLAVIQRQLHDLRAEAARERSRVESDEKLIENLKQRLEKLDVRNQAIEQTSQQLKNNDLQLKETTAQQIQGLQSQLAGANISPLQFDSFMSRYLGQHQFTFAGAAAGDFIYDRQTNQNTFALVFEPLVLYRLNDWILFEAEIEAGLPEGSSANSACPSPLPRSF